MENSHANKAESYDIGRPEYPAVFFDFLYGEAGFNTNDVIADIGCGTGKVTKHFLERGNKVIAIEPDSDMLRVSDEKLKKYPNYSSFQRTAEDTRLETSSIDRIFCGNSYYWFDRSKAVPEFRRILRKNGTIVTSWIGGDVFNKYGDEFYDIYIKYSKPVSRKNDKSPVFLPGTFLEKAFLYTIYQTADEFLHGLLSEADAPAAGTDEYEPFCDGIKKIFEKHSNNGKLETDFKARCMIGTANNLILS